MTAPKQYILDANVFITAHREYYAFDIAPRFWDQLLKHAAAGNIWSISQVYDDITRGLDPKSGEASDRLAVWAVNEFKPFFRDTDDIFDTYLEIINWVANNSHYTGLAKKDFAEVSDSWLVASAKALNAVLVTLEKPRNTQTRVPIPSVCARFNIDYMNTFDMMRALGITLK
ncbi:MAG: DUF4411 family protein [Candidatus Cloacimonetes bacterium]|nr:DUF4411 family protein [Candidatus Cloacimonadota bacterium]NLO12338.1 DUF4411 family protein [Candidatus Cloacimonadota bacterium]